MWPRGGRRASHTVLYSTAQYSTRRVASTRQRASTLAGAAAGLVSRVVSRKWSSIILSRLDSDSSPRWSPSIRTSSQLSHLRLPYFTSNFCEAADRALAPQVTTPPNRPRRCWGRLPPPESWRRWSTRRAVGSFPFVKPFRFVWSSAGRSHAAALS